MPQAANPATDGLADSFLELERKIKLDIRTCIPCKVVAANPALCTVDVELGFLQVAGMKVGNLQAIDTPSPPYILLGIPVAWPATNLGSHSASLVPGDTGFVVITDRDYDAWRLLAQACDPKKSDAHPVGSAIFLPCILSAPQTPIAVPPFPGAMVEGENVSLGALAALGVARLTDKTIADTTMTAWISVVQSSLTTLAGVFGLPLPIPPSDFGIINVASTKVRAE